MREEATVTSKGQVTIPQDIRAALGLKTGEKIVFVARENEVVIRLKIKNPVSRLRELRKEIKFTEKQIDQMIKESKKEWSKFE
jgi:AbrB family looped-hinge helix DNA binding protein